MKRRNTVDWVLILLTVVIAFVAFVIALNLVERAIDHLIAHLKAPCEQEQKK